MKRKWLIVLSAVLIAALAGVFCFRDTLMIRLFPKVVLSKAIGETFEQLNERYAYSPGHLLANGLDSRGCQKVSMKLDTSTQFMGIAHYNLELNTQTAPNRIRGEGTVSTGSGIMDLSLYLDENFGAVSSNSLTEGTYYGITYDTFSRDIRGYPLIAFLAGEEALAGWETSVSDFAETMRRSYTLPELSSEDIRTALLGALALKPKVEAGEKGEYTITFQAEGREVAEAAEPYLSQAPEALTSLVRTMEAEDDSKIQVVFYLNNQQLTRVDAGITLGMASYQISAKNKDNTLELELLLQNGDNLERTEMTVQSSSNTVSYQETIHVIRTLSGVQSRYAVDYTWDLSSGDMAMKLTREGKEYPIRLNLTGDEESFTVSTQEFDMVMRAFTGKDNSSDAICTLKVSPGEPITQVPEYRNISQWSLDDFWLLLERIGSLVGIKLP